MNDFPVARVWRGWRRPDLKPDHFLNQLSSVFIPATWLVMGRLGLQCYVPTVLTPQEHIPDEVALLIYPSATVYDDARRRSVAGRAYSALHDAVFNFSSAPAAPPVSGTHQAVPWTGNDTAGPTALDGPRTWWRRAETAAAQFVDQTTVISVALLTHDPATHIDMDGLQRALGGWNADLVLHTDTHFTILWLASAQPVDTDALGTALQAAWPAARLALLQSAGEIWLPTDDAFAPCGRVPIGLGQTLSFRAAKNLTSH